MARTNSNTEQKDTNKVIETKEVDYKKEYDSLKSQFDEMKSMFQQLMEQKKQENKEEKIIDNSDYIDEEAPIIPSNKLINVTNLFDGELNLIGDNNKPICFKRFGMTLPITFSDLHFACSNHQRFASQGYFFIHNKEVIKALYLEDEYKKIINKTTIENILKLSDKQIRETIDNVTDAIKETILTLIVKGINEDKPEYSNRIKIDLISELIGKDIRKIAQQLKELEENKK